MPNYSQASRQTTPNIYTYSERNYTLNSVLNEARWAWSEILESLGIGAQYLNKKHGPCPICGGRDRFRFDNKEGRGTFFCNCCGAGGGVKLLQLYHGWSYADACNIVVQLLGKHPWERQCISGPKHISSILNKMPLVNQASDLSQNDYEKRRNVLSNTWKQAKAVSLGDPVDCYLRARYIKLSEFPSVLRVHPQLPYYNDDGVLIGKFPAMLALVQDKDNQNVTIHRTYLGNGCKASVPKPKKLMSPITPGASLSAAIKLYKPTDGKLVIAEGIETALCFQIATQLPVWAAVSAGGMEKVILPESVIEVIIAVDNDRSGRGQEAAARLAKRLLAEGRTVKRVMPHKVGYDFADMLVEANQ